MRITMSTMMRQYSSRLNRSGREVSRAMTRVVTGRLYEKASENPGLAVRASQLNRQHAKNEDYIANLRDVMGTFEVAEGTMTQISKVAEEAYVGILSAVNGTMGEDERGIFAQQLRTMQQQIVMDANERYSDKYVFGGTSTKELPFALAEDGTLTFRGIDVNSTNPGDQAMLQRMSEENMYVDLGFGIQFDPSAPEANTVVRGSAFDTAMPGINFLGFGTDADGMPNNIITLLGQAADALADPNYSYGAMKPYMEKLDGARREILVSITELGTKSMFMEFTESRLSDAQFTLEDRIATTTMIDSELAIMQWEAQQYAYNAALKMGPNILSQSFIDFMN